MRLYLAFSGEGKTDNRFVPNIINRLISEYMFQNNITAEFSWNIIRRTGSSKNNILDLCKRENGFTLVFFHRDSGNDTWEDTFNNHLSSALEIINNDRKERYLRLIVPVIPVKETEAWMLYDKKLLIDKIGVNLTEQELQLDYKISNIENVSNPKERIENAIEIYKLKLPVKRRKYSVSISDLYDEIALEIELEKLNSSPSFSALKMSLQEKLDKIFK